MLYILILGGSLVLLLRISKVFLKKYRFTNKKNRIEKNSMVGTEGPVRLRYALLEYSSTIEFFFDYVFFLGELFRANSCYRLDSDVFQCYSIEV